MFFKTCQVKKHCALVFRYCCAHSHAYPDIWLACDSVDDWVHHPPLSIIDIAGLVHSVQADIILQVDMDLVTGWTSDESLGYGEVIMF